MKTTTVSKPWYKSWIIWYAIISGIAGLVASLTSQFPDVALFAVLNSVIVGLLRVLTTAQPISGAPTA